MLKFHAVKMAVAASSVLALAGCVTPDGLMQQPYGQNPYAPAPAYNNNPYAPAPVYNQNPNPYAPAPAYNPNPYVAAPAVNTAGLLYGTVGQVNVVPANAPGNRLGVGTLVGGAIGGVLTKDMGGKTTEGKVAAAAAGAALGALIGNVIENQAFQGGGVTPAQNVYRVNVRTNDNQLRSFDYAQAPNVRPGDRVYIQGNQVYRY